jgi:hypothetical protein
MGFGEEIEPGTAFTKSNVSWMLFLSLKEIIQNSKGWK